MARNRERRNPLHMTLRRPAPSWHPSERPRRSRFQIPDPRDGAQGAQTVGVSGGMFVYTGCVSTLPLPGRPSACRVAVLTT